MGEDGSVSVTAIFAINPPQTAQAVSSHSCRIVSLPREGQFGCRCYIATAKSLKHEIDILRRGPLYLSCKLFSIFLYVRLNRLNWFCGAINTTYSKPPCGRGNTTSQSQTAGGTRLARGVAAPAGWLAVRRVYCSAEPIQPVKSCLQKDAE